MVRGLDVEFKVEMLPDVLHVRPVLHYPVAERIPDFEQSPHMFRIFSDIQLRVVLCGSDDLPMFGSPDTSWRLL